MTVRIYRSTDASAPVLSGQAGALADLLDAVLVNGYGAKTAAGWAIAYTGTNLRAYRAASGLRHYLYLDDTGTTDARAFGYEAMTSISAGTGAFPTTGQVSGGNYWRKATTAGATARPWKIIADEKRFYFQVLTNVGNDYYTFDCFGEFKSFYGADSFATMHFAADTGIDYGTFQGIGTIGSSVGVQSGHYVPRIGSGAGNSVNASKGLLILGSAAGSQLGNGALAFPHTPDSGLWLSPILIQTDAYLVRGSIPGVWAGLQTLPTVTYPDGVTTVSGAGNMAGKTFELWRCGYGNSAVWVETSDTWDV